MSQSEENYYPGFKAERPLTEALVPMPSVPQPKSNYQRTIIIQEPFDPKAILQMLDNDERAALLQELLFQ